MTTTMNDKLFNFLWGLMLVLSVLGSVLFGSWFFNLINATEANQRPHVGQYCLVNNDLSVNWSDCITPTGKEKAQ